MTVVDIGAHGGYFSLIGASRVGATGRVYAFEPYPASFEELQRNIEPNGYKNIHAVRKAVSDRTGVHKLLVNILVAVQRSEEHTSELQSHLNIVCRLLLEKKKMQVRHTKRARTRP